MESRLKNLEDLEERFRGGVQRNIKERTDNQLYMQKIEQNVDLKLNAISENMEEFGVRLD